MRRRRCDPLSPGGAGNLSCRASYETAVTDFGVGARKGLSAVRGSSVQGHDRDMQPLTRVQALDLLTAAPVAHIGVISNGEPYVTPISFVVTGNLIALRTVPGRRLEAIRENPRVCIEASEFDPTSGEWARATVWGSAHGGRATPPRATVAVAMPGEVRRASGI